MEKMENMKSGISFAAFLKNQNPGLNVFYMFKFGRFSILLSSVA